MDTAKFQVLSEHYAQTFDLLQGHLKRRDRTFAGVLLLLIIMLFQLFTPDEASNLMTDIVSNKLGLETPIDFLYVLSVVWFVLLASTTKYFQSVILIERQYEYVSALEGELNSHYEGVEFTREGKSYSSNYPAFLNWASFLYTVLFPAILAIVVTAKIIGEFSQYGSSEFLVWFNGMIFVFIGISTLLYLRAIHFGKKEEDSEET